MQTSVEPTQAHYGQDMLPAAAIPPEGLIQVDLLFDTPPSEAREQTGKMPRRSARQGRHGVLGVSRTTFYRLVEKGYIPAPVKIGRRSLMPVADVRAAIQTIALGVAKVR